MLSGSQNRAAIIGVGYWGARMITHMWPRLRNSDRGRALAPTALSDAPGSRRLPRISDIVSHTLILPADDGSLTIARPKPELWEDVSLLHLEQQVLEARAEADGEALKPGGREMQAAFCQALLPIVEVVGRYEVTGFYHTPAWRRDIWQCFLQNRAQIGSDLAAIFEQARADESTPAEETSQLTVFVVASLAEEYASAVLWPLANLLRERVGSRVLAEMVGILSTGLYAPAAERKFEEATVHVASLELRELTSAAGRGQLASFSADIHGGMVSGLAEPPFDRTYLIDREKASGSLIKDESELNTMVGNALEAFLTAGGSEFINNALAPDAADLLRSGPFSSLGSASVYIPFEEAWSQARRRLTLDILRGHVLSDISERTANAAAELADQFLQQRLDFYKLSRSLLSEGIVRADVGDVDRERAHDALPKVQVRLPPSDFLRTTILPLSDLDEHTATLNERFDQIEKEFVENWVSDLEARGERLISDPSVDAGDQFDGSVLYELDQEILKLLTTLDDGMQAALAFLQSLGARVREKQERLSRLQWQYVEKTNTDTAQIIRQRLAAIESRLVRRIIAAWPAVLAVLSLAAFVIVALSSTDMELAPLLTRAGGVALIVLFWGLILYFLIRGWLIISLGRVRSFRQTRLEGIARAYLAEVLLSQFERLAGEIVRRQRVLEEAMEALGQERHSLAVQLSETEPAAGSFVRQPLVHTTLGESLRAQPTSLPEHPVQQAFREVPGSHASLWRAWRQAVQRRGGYRSGEDGGDPAARGLAEAYRLVLDRFTTRLCQPITLANVDVEELLPRVVPTHLTHDFLNSLYQWSKPCIHLNDQTAVVPITIDLLAVPQASAFESSELGARAALLNLHLLTSYNPFSIILVRTIHGFPLHAVASLQTYAESYTSLTPEERQRLMISGAVADSAREEAASSRGRKG